MQDVIRSPSNQLLKRARAVAAGREAGLVLLEGQRLVREALSASWELEVLLVSERLEDLSHELRAELDSRGANTVGLQRVEHGLIEGVSAMKGAPGVLAIARTPAPLAIGALESGASALLVLAAGVQDPGNLGAIARAAEAAGATGLVVVGDGARPFGPKALRGSMGSLLRLPVAIEADGVQCARHLAQSGWRQVITRTRGGLPYAGFDWSGPLALWLAAESGNLPAGVAEEAINFEGVSIPMAGAVESLNVATAAAILCFSAGRVSAASASKGGT